MSAAATLASQILTASSQGLASLAAERLVARLGSDACYGDDPRTLWREHLAGRLGDLSVAVASGRSRQFLDQVAWAKVAFGARGLPTDDLELGLQCLRDVLAEELSEMAAQPVLACLDQTLERWDDLGSKTAPSGLATDQPAGRLAARYVVALLEGDRRRACELVLGAVTRGDLSARQALLEVCLPAQRELGRMWHLDEITVAEEHFVSATTVTLMGRLSALAPAAEPNGKAVVAASLAGNDHDIGLRAVSDLFEMDGWRVVFLGGNLPAEDLVWAVSGFAADLVVLSATLPAHVSQLAHTVGRLRSLQGELGRVPVLVGGHAFEAGDDLWRDVSADAPAPSVSAAVAVGRRLVGLGG